MAVGHMGQPAATTAVKKEKVGPGLTKVTLGFCDTVRVKTQNDINKELACMQVLGQTLARIKASVDLRPVWPGPRSRDVPDTLSDKIAD